MTERKGNDYWALAINAISIALVAVVTMQVFHESCHAIAAVLVGARLEWINFLFGIQYTPVEGMRRCGDIIIAASASLMNILTGMIAVALFSRRWVMRRPTLRLFLVYFSAYSLLTASSNLVVNALLYQPGAKPLGDWEVVLSAIGGGLLARFAVGLLGAAGIVWVYFWLVHSTLRFGKEVMESHQRAGLAGPLLMEPYLMINAIFLLLSIWNPFGFGGFRLIVLQYGVGYAVFPVAFFGVVYWTRVRTPPQNATPLLPQANWPWRVGAAVTLAIVAAVLLPTIYF